MNLQESNMALEIRDRDKVISKLCISIVAKMDVTELEDYAKQKLYEYFSTTHNDLELFNLCEQQHVDCELISEE